MTDVKLLNRRDRAVVAIAAVVAALSLVSATLLAFAADSRTEWFACGSDAALAARRCVKAVASGARHACLREVAEARRAAETASTRMAKRRATRAATGPKRAPVGWSMRSRPCASSRPRRAYAESSASAQ